MRSSRLLLSVSLLLLLDISRAFRSPKPPSSLVISRKPSTSLYAYRDRSKGIDVGELVIGSLRRLPSPVLVAITAVSSTLLVLEVSKFLVLAALPTVIGLAALTTATVFGGWFIIMASATVFLFSPLLVTAFAAINLSSILTMGISYMVISFAVQTLMTSNTTPEAPQRPPKIIDVSPITEDDDANLEEQRRLRDFDRRLKDRF